MTTPDATTRLAIARDWFPGRPHVTTLRRWSAVGIVGPTGCRVRLQTIRVGGRSFTTRAWADEFLAAVAVVRADATPVASVTDERRTSRGDEARKQLAARGFYAGR